MEEKDKKTYVIEAQYNINEPKVRVEVQSSSGTPPLESGEKIVLILQDQAK